MPGHFKIMLTVILLPLTLFYGKAQYRFDKAIRLTEENKLPSNDVRAVQLAADGFAWIATTDGLCRFDGQAVKVYANNPQDSTSIFAGTVNATIAWHNEIWTATNKGISALNLKTEKFRHYQVNQPRPIKKDFDGGASVLFCDKQGDLWAGTPSQGVWLYDSANDNFRNFPYPKEAYSPIFPSLASNITILSIESSTAGDGIVWAGTPSGLEEINKKTGEVKWYTFPQKDKDYQVAVNAFRRLYYHDDGLLYVGSWGAGMNIFDPVKKTFQPLPVKDGPGVDILKTPIARLVRKSRNEIWITALNGLVLYDTDKKAISFYKYNNGVKNEFYGVDCVDSLHRVWLGTINGVYYFDPVMQQFATYSYDELYGINWGFAFYLSEEADKKIMVCPREANAFYLFDKDTKTWMRQEIPELKKWKLKQITIRGFTKFPDGNYFISADQGLFVYKKQTKQLVRYANPPKTQFDQWGDALVDKNGNLWVAANADGLVQRDLKTGAQRIFKKELVLPGETYSPKVSNLFEDSHHNIWFSCHDGFGVYRSDTKEVIVFLHNQNAQNSFPFVNSFAEDKKGRIWINNSDSWIGYAHIDSVEKGIVKKVSLEEKGIVNKAIHLATDKGGTVWGYNKKYLFKVADPEKPFALFSFDYGISNPDFFHFSFLSTGEMIFGGRNSITLANPMELRRNKELPVPYVVQVKLLNQHVSRSLFSENQLNLNHRQNFFALSFSAKAYTMSQATKFRYRLKGFDDWIETREDRLANYTNVPPGNYTFQLQAANNEGIWNQQLLELPVHIKTPWWQAWWFKIITLIAIVLFTGWLYQYRIGQIRKKEQLRSQYEKKLANVEMSALLAQMNPHFLFNSLNSIDSYIIRNESKKASEYLNNFARLVRLILQNSRSNYISLKDELESLDLYLQMESLRFANRFSYEIKVMPDIDVASVLIPPMLIQPYVENAIWHGLMHKKDGVDGKVELLITKKEDNLFCVIQDNGIGREKAEALRARHPGNRKRSMGMQITKDRIEMINKLYNTNTTMQVIDLHDKDGNPKGTRVELMIPI